MMILDTCFLIDLQREIKKRLRGPAADFLEKSARESFAISVISVVEFLEGFADRDHGMTLLQPYRKLGIDESVARQAGSFRRSLRQQGQLIGDFDILIAATAVVHQVPLVTDNEEHFQRFPDLRIIGYRRD